MNQTWKTYKPSSRFLRAWLFTCTGAFIVLATAMTLFDVNGGILLWCVLPILTAFLYAILVRARFRYNDEMVQQRYVRNTTQYWRDAVAWSYHSINKRRFVYIQFNDGTVLGSTALLFCRDEIFDLIPSLMKHIGEPSREDNIVLPALPWPLSSFRKPSKTRFDDCDRRRDN